MDEIEITWSTRSVPLDDCFWVRIEPAGHVTGSLQAVIGSEEITTPEQAHRRIVPRKRDRDRDIRKGYTHRLMTPEQWDRDAKPCLRGECDH